MATPKLAVRLGNGQLLATANLATEILATDNLATANFATVVPVAGSRPRGA